MSFTLNRVYTEWYRNKGYDFTITSSTAFDQKWIYGRNIFQNISDVVDEMFGNYLSRPNVKQPILTQYCDGRQVSCPNWMTQWGSQSLGQQGYSTIEILRYYYGESIYMNTAVEIAGVPSSWPGYGLPGNKGAANAGTAECDCGVLSGASHNNGRWRLRTGHESSRGEISVHLWTSGNRDCRLPDLVQDIRNLCGCIENCRALENYKKFWKRKSLLF